MSIEELKAQIEKINERLSRLESKVHQIEKMVKEATEETQITLEDVRNAIVILEKFERNYKRMVRLQKRISSTQGLPKGYPSFGSLLQMFMSQRQQATMTNVDEEEEEEEELPENVKKTIQKLRQMRKKKAI